jgi:hypothetical protein
MVHDRCIAPLMRLLKQSQALYQLSYLSLPVRTSASAAQVGGWVYLDGYTKMLKTFYWPSFKFTKANCNFKN